MQPGSHDLPATTPTVSIQPTQLPEGTNTPIPTKNPTLIPETVVETSSEPVPTEEVVLPREPYRLEEFDDEIDGWRWFITSGSEDKTEIFRDRGRVVFELIEKDIYAYLMNDDYEYEDVKISARVENRAQNTYSVSLICRYDEQSGWYEFNIGGDGLYNILRYEGTVDEGKYVFLANGGSNQIRTGREFNEYAVSCKGDTLTVWINDKETQSFKDDTLKKGLIGISASSYYATPVIVEFEYVDITQP